MTLALPVILVLAVVQGFAEFLPISSSGHLVIVAALLSDDPKHLEVSDVNIVLHFGTLLSIVVFYWQRIRSLLTQDRRVVGLLILGTIPAVVVGLPIKKWGEFLLEDPALAGLLLFVTAGVLLIVSRLRHSDRSYSDLSAGRAFLIGAAQAVAILPGISRSGMTIATGLGLGLSRQSAATFSFLLAIPAIGGATLLEIKDMISDPSGHQTPILHLFVGATVSFVVGLFALWWLVRWLERGRLIPFAIWCIAMGLLVVWRYGFPGA